MVELIRLFNGGFIKMKERVYQGIIVVILILFTIFFMVSHHNYMGVLESNEDLLKLINDKDTQRETVINMWEENYSNLEESYCRLAIENSRLKEVLIHKYGYTEKDLPIYDTIEDTVFTYEGKEVN